MGCLTFKLRILRHNKHQISFPLFPVTQYRPQFADAYPIPVHLLSIQGSMEEKKCSKKSDFVHAQPKSRFF